MQAEDRRREVGGCGESSAVRSLEARCTVPDVVVLVDELTNAIFEARGWVVAGGGHVEYRRYQEAVSRCFVAIRNVEEAARVLACRGGLDEEECAVCCPCLTIFTILLGKTDLRLRDGRHNRRITGRIVGKQKRGCAGRDKVVVCKASLGRERSNIARSDVKSGT